MLEIILAFRGSVTLFWIDFKINCRLLLGVVAPSLSLSFVPSGVPWLRIISTIYVSNQLLEGDIIMCINKN